MPQIQKLAGALLQISRSNGMLHAIYKSKKQCISLLAACSLQKG